MNRVTATRAALVTAAALALPAMATAATNKTVTPEDSGKTVRLKQGDKLTISLADNNPSTGYAWSYSTRPSKKVLRLVSDKTARPPATNPPTVGAPAPRTIVYRAVGRGETKLRMVYRRSGGDTANTLKLTIKVR